MLIFSKRSLDLLKKIGVENYGLLNFRFGQRRRLKPISAFVLPTVMSQRPAPPFFVG